METDASQNLTPAQVVARFAPILEAGRVCMIERAQDRSYHWASENFEDVMGFTFEQFRRFPDTEGLDAALAEQLRAFFEQVQHLSPGDPPIEGDYEFTDDSGLSRFVHVRIQVVADDGRVLVRAIAIDATESRAQQRLLDQLNQEVAEFSYLAGHDLKAPLRRIRALITMLREDFPDIPAELLEGFDRLEGQAESMQQMINDLLEYARIDHAEHVPEPFLLSDLVDEIRQLHANQSRVEIISECSQETVVTDRIPLATCMRNLVDNAVKFHPGPNGSVRVRCGVTPKVLTVVVSDDGPGIPENAQESIFRPFRSYGDGGTGMGLAAIKKLVTGRGGSIEVDSAPGAGSTFTIIWPLQRPE